MYFFILVILLCIPWDEIFNKEHAVYQRASKLYFYGAPVLNILLLLLGTVLLIDDTYNPFIYFRF